MLGTTLGSLGFVIMLSNSHYTIYTMLIKRKTSFEFALSFLLDYKSFSRF